MKTQIEPVTQQGYKLLHEGTDLFADMEQAGMRVDVHYVKHKLNHLKHRRIPKLKQKLMRYDTLGLWKKKRGNKFNIDSDAQLREVLFDEMQLKPIEFTEKGAPAVGAAALEQMDLPMAEDFVLYKRLNTAVKKLEELQRETVDGFVHPSFSLHLVKTYRSSCRNPNDQNNQKRVREIAAIIRNSRIPKEGRFLAELDFKGQETRISACYHRDPQYIKDVQHDMHKEITCKCYCLKPEEMSKILRFYGKNKMTFAQLYGSFWKDCAPALWEAVNDPNCKLKNGTHIKEHLQRKFPEGLGSVRKNRKGRYVAEPNTFMQHIKNVENWLWKEKYPVYQQWKYDVWDLYCKRGWFDHVTGFREYGLYSRNDVTNHLIQGPAFHCLLYVLIQLNKERKKRNWKSSIIAQIHDSFILDVYPPEWLEIQQVVKNLVEGLQNVYEWLIVPLEMDCEVAPVNGTWNELEEAVLAA